MNKTKEEIERNERTKELITYLSIAIPIGILICYKVILSFL